MYIYTPRLRGGCTQCCQAMLLSMIVLGYEIYTYICTCVYIYRYVYMYIYICIHVYIHFQRLRGGCTQCCQAMLLSMIVVGCENIYEYVYLYICVYICIYVYMYICIYTPRDCGVSS